MRVRLPPATSNVPDLRPVQHHRRPRPDIDISSGRGRPCYLRAGLLHERVTVLCSTQVPIGVGRLTPTASVRPGATNSGRVHFHAQSVAGTYRRTTCDRERANAVGRMSRAAFIVAASTTAIHTSAGPTCATSSDSLLTA